MFESMLDTIAANTPSDEEIEQRGLCWWCYGPLDEGEWSRFRATDGDDAEFNLHLACVEPLEDVIEEVEITPAFRDMVDEFIAENYVGLRKLSDK